MSCEAHSDGTPHLHAFVVLDVRLRTSNAKFADLTSSAGIAHGNYQVAKNYMFVIKYVTKGKDFIEHNMDVKNELAAREGKTKLLGQRLLAGESLVTMV